MAETGCGLDQGTCNPSDVIMAGVEALGLLGVGVAVADRACSLLLTNRMAEGILATRDGLQVTRAGVIETVDQGHGKPLRAAIQQVVNVAASGREAFKNFVLAVRRPSGKRPLTLVVRAVRSETASADAMGTVLLLMLDPVRPIQVTESGLRQLYGLTPREAGLAQLLMSGKNLEECCNNLEICPSTARMHLANLFAKTGAQRQGQLISLLLKSVGMICMSSPEWIENQTVVRVEPREVNGRRACLGGRRLDVMGAGLQALELLDIGVSVTDSSGRLLFANETAGQILSARDGLAVTAQGTLSIARKYGNPLLSALNARAGHAVGCSLSPEINAVVSVRRPSGKRPLVLFIRSLDRNGTPPRANQPAVVVLIMDSEIPISLSQYGLRQLYGFTPSEVRLAQLLMEGTALDDSCQRLGIRASTARMHLANMFAKTGVQRQGPLISLLMKSLGVVREKTDDQAALAGRFKNLSGAFNSLASSEPRPRRLSPWMMKDEERSSLVWVNNQQRWKRV